MTHERIYGAFMQYLINFTKNSWSVDFHDICVNLPGFHFSFLICKSEGPFSVNFKTIVCLCYFLMLNSHWQVQGLLGPGLAPAPALTQSTVLLALACQPGDHFTKLYLDKTASCLLPAAAAACCCLQRMMYCIRNIHVVVAVVISIIWACTMKCQCRRHQHLDLTSAEGDIEN